MPEALTDSYQETTPLMHLRPANDAKRAAAAGEELRVLIIEDDDDDAAFAMDALFGCEGVSVVARSVDGEQALRTLSSDDIGFDLILLDLNMPRVDGFEFLQRMREQPGYSGVPVVALTTSSYFQDVRRALGGSASCFVTKPDTLPELNEKLAKIVRCVRSGEMLDRRL